MKRYLTIIGLIATFLLILFFVVEHFRIPFLTDPAPWLTKRSPQTAFLGVLLLTIDVVVPIPSSLVMTTNGVLFGVIGGSCISLLGGLCSALTGFALGKCLAPVVRRLITEKDWVKTQQLISDWGTVGVIITRPIPILAETMVLVAGTTTMSWFQLITSSILGLLPTALLYSISGATATSFGSPLAAFFLSLIIAASFLWLGRKLK